MSSTVRYVSHLHLVVADLARSVHFYRTAFEFEERYTSAAGVVFLRSLAGGSLALEQAGADRPPGLGHFGFSLDDPSDVDTVVDASSLPEAAWWSRTSWWPDGRTPWSPIQTAT